MSASSYATLDEHRVARIAELERELDAARESLVAHSQFSKTAPSGYRRLTHDDGPDIPSPTALEDPGSRKEPGHSSQNDESVSRTERIRYDCPRMRQRQHEKR